MPVKVAQVRGDIITHDVAAVLLEFLVMLLLVLFIWRLLLLI